MNAAPLDRTLAQLRQAFDEAFARPQAEPQADAIDIVVVSAGEQAYALRTRELAGLEVDRRIVPLPVAGAPGLLGLCAAQGELVPVFELAAVLGAGGAKAAPRWLALHRGADLVGLAFDELRETRRVSASGVSALELAPGHGPFSREAVRLESGMIHLLDMAAVVAACARKQ